MSKKIRTLNDVFIGELADLYNAEKQLVKAIPKIVKAMSFSELKTAMENHLEETKGHVQRLERAFQELDQKIPAKTCKAMKGLIEEGKEVIEESEVCAARDAALIGAAQRVEHYEVAGYGTAATHASLLGHNSIQKLLLETLQEEKNANTSLSQLAEEFVNLQAR